MVAASAKILSTRSGLLSLKRTCPRATAVQKTVVRASNRADVQDVIVKSTALASFAGSLLYSGNAQAAVEVANIAAGDGRSGLLFLPLTAAIGWVLFNIAGPAKNQIDSMKGLAIGTGITAASLLAAQSADASEIMQVAAGDGRSGLLFLPLAAAIGWVLFNIAGPAKNQIDNMKSVAIGAGITAASLLAAQGADASEVMQVAAGDGRSGLLFLPLTAAIGWVLFNIAGPAKNQIDNMKSLAIGTGVTAASLLAAQSADASEIMQVAAGDGRSGLLFLPLTAAIGWVLFNIAGPAKNQIDNMKSVAVGAGVTAASLLAAQSADAAEIMQVAAGDGRSGLLFLPLTAAIGWVLFNIAGPAKNQIDNMK